MTAQNYLAVPNLSGWQPSSDQSDPIDLAPQIGVPVVEGTIAGQLQHRALGGRLAVAFEHGQEGAAEMSMAELALGVGQMLVGFPAIAVQDAPSRSLACSSPRPGSRRNTSVRSEVAAQSHMRISPTATEAGFVRMHRIRRLYLRVQIRMGRSHGLAGRQTAGLHRTQAQIHAHHQPH